MIIKALEVATGISSEKIEKDWAKKGDLGEVASELVGTKRQRTLFSSELTVLKVFENAL